MHTVQIVSIAMMITGLAGLAGLYAFAPNHPLDN